METRQKRAISDMMAIGTACEEFYLDGHNYYPKANTIEELAQILKPDYWPTFIGTDLWGNKYHYKSFAEKDGKPQGYVIVCTGRDGILEHQNLEEYLRGGGTTVSFNGDIAFSNGSFIQLPDSLKHLFNR